MFKQGQLEKLYMLPPEFGGEDIPQNTLYVPIGIVAIKTRTDNNIIRPLIQDGAVSQYSAVPEYQGTSFIPIRLRIRAFNPGDFSTEINIWGDALQIDAAPISGDEDVVAKPDAAIDLAPIATTTPEETVMSFVRAHNTWENMANRRAKELGFGSAGQIATQEYRQLISQLCTASVKPQPISFGNPPKHHPELETIQSVSTDGTKAIVATKYVDSNGFESRYEYCLAQEAERWRIDSLLYVDDEEKLECL